MEITYKSKFHGNAYIYTHQSVESPRMNPYTKSILATAIAVSATLIPANAGQLKITVDSARHVVIIPAVEGWSRRGRGHSRRSYIVARHHSHHSLAVAAAGRPARTRRGCSMVSAHTAP